jgi:hypothetical protein
MLRLPQTNFKDAIVVRLLERIDLHGFGQEDLLGVLSLPIGL